MQSLAIFVAVLAVASAANYVHVPRHDSAVIESHRLGGSFAYKSTEGHAVGVVSPVVQNVVSPVATSYSVPATYSVPTTYSVPATYSVPTTYSVPATYSVPTTYGNVAVVKSANTVVPVAANYNYGYPYGYSTVVA